MSLALNIAYAAALVVIAWLIWGATRPRPADRAHAEQAKAAREIDDLELLYGLPAYDPAWDAGLERLWDAIRDEQNHPRGEDL